MHLHDSKKSSEQRLLCLRLGLAIAWLSGFFAGLFTAFALRDRVESLARVLASAHFSGVGLFFSLSIPLIITVIVFRLSRQVWIVLFSFVKAFIFSFVSYAILLAFGSAGWLVRCLYIFSDSFMTVYLLWFWVRNLSDKAKSFKIDLLLGFLLLTILAFIEASFISPLISLLLH